MLTLEIPGLEMFDDELQKFVYTNSETVRLEHSLVSLSLWESKWKKSFLSTPNKTTEQTVDYIRMMSIEGELTLEQVMRLGEAEFTKIREYIEDAQTATTFAEMEKSRGREIVTAEVIYQWIVAFNVPWEAQNWHLNKLFTLLRVISAKNAPPKKMGANQLASRNAKLNAQRRAQMGSPG